MVKKTQLRTIKGILLAGCLLSAADAGALALSSNGLTVMRVAGTSGTNGVNAYLEEYDRTTGDGLQTIDLTQAAVNASKNFTFSTPSFVGRDRIYQRSDDGSSLALAGYNAGVGSAITGAGLTITRIGADGTPEFSTGSSFSGGVRGIASKDGTRFWLTSSDDLYNLRTLAFGSSGQMPAPVVAGKWRGTFVSNGQLYATSGSSGFRGVAKIGNGTPTSNSGGDPTVTFITSADPNTSTSPGVNDAFFLSSTVMYASGTGNGSLGEDFRQYSLNSTTSKWDIQSAASPGGTVFGIWAETDTGSEGGTFIYASTNTKLYKLWDASTTDALFPSFTASWNNGTTSGLVWSKDVASGSEFGGLAPSAVPEPSSLGLMGVAGVFTLRRRRRT